MPSKSKKLHLLTLAAGLALVFSNASLRVASAQTGEDDDEAGARQIKITDFTKERDKPSWNVDEKRAPRKAAPRRVYKRVAVRRAPRPAVAQTRRPARAAKPEYAEIGVTIWRLRKATASDDGPKLQDAGGDNWWIPERIEGTTPLNVGDRIRLSIESPRTGYLYVINTTQYAGNTYSQPKLIFPVSRTRGGDNRVMAGRLIDLPDVSDDTNYYTLTANQKAGEPRQIGEVLTVLVSKEPIAELSNKTRSAIALQPEQVARWEKQWGGQVEFELDGGAGLAWTKEEQDASAGGRGLTQEDATPQTIYSVPSRPGGPLLVKVQLLYNQSGTAKK
ncbi:MAG TPA: DUF4384 domain-containing protein [Pyrinomonadaceae bacterium]|jgi:hypothetical protein|nr:DUF4384 domain-containing protein [Pyrinomonadaceae bacterium]